MGFLSKGIDSRGPGKGLKWKLEGQLQRSELLHGEDGRGHPNRDSYDVNLLPPTLSGSWWRDRKVASLQFQHTVQYSPIRREYQVTLGEKGTSRVTQNFEEAKRWMAKVQEAEIKPSSESSSMS
jgi:hypothetical protein